MPDLNEAIAKFAAEAKAKLTNPSVVGEPEDQLRAPLESLTTVSESSLSNLKARPD